jgi:hypothetical protein
LVLRYLLIHKQGLDSTQPNLQRGASGGAIQLTHHGSTLTNTACVEFEAIYNHCILPLDGKLCHLVQAAQHASLLLILLKGHFSLSRMSTEELFIREAYQYHRQDIYNEARLQLMRQYNIPIPGSVSHRLWQLFGAILTGKMGRSGPGLDLQDYEVKSSTEGASFEYQYHLNTGEAKLLEDMKASHIFISYSPDYQNVTVRTISGSSLEALFQSWLPGFRARYESQESNRRYRRNIPLGTVRQQGTIIMQIQGGKLIYPPSF